MIDVSRYEKKLVIREIEEKDIDEVVKMAQAAFGNPDIAFERKHYESHIKIFPEGQVLVEYDGKIIGSSSSVIVNYDEYGHDHSFDEISGNNYITNHNPEGRNLYGIDVVVHPDYRHLKIGRRLYEERRKLCQRLNLESIIFGGRIPNYHKYADKMTAEEYVKQVEQHKIYDPVLRFQLTNGFKVHTVKANYLIDDVDSLEYATIMEWKNIDYNRKPHEPAVRIAAIQYKLRDIKSFDEFAVHCESIINNCSKKRTDFVVFPELLSLQLVGLTGKRTPNEQMYALTEYTDDYINLFADLAIRYSINIVSGSHFVKEGDAVYNTSFLFHRNGTIDQQSQLHLSPEDRKWRGVEPTNEINVFDTDCGKVAVLLGYDIQFPEISRIVVDKGADILFVPFQAEDEQSYLRTRYCAQARAVENQVYTVTAGLVGNLPNVHHLNMMYGKSTIFSPSDYCFAHQGIVAESDANVETILFGEVDLEMLRRNREIGTVTPLKDRRTDLYTVDMKK